MMRVWLIPAALAAYLSLGHPALAASYTLAPAQDATIFDLAGGPLADGTGDLWIGVTAGGFDRRALLRFDLSAIPAGESIVSAQLQLYVTRSIRSGDDTTVLHRMLMAWSEGPSYGGGAGVSAVAGDVTWLHRSYPDDPWGTAGGDFAASASASQSVGAVVSPTLVEYSGPGLLADLQQWHAQSQSNFGWILLAVPQGEAVTAKRFASRENGVSSLRPQLVVNTIPVPEPGAYVMLLAGLGMIGLALRRNTH